MSQPRGKMRSTRQIMALVIYALFVLFIFQFGSELCTAIDTITPTHFLRDPESIVSNNSIFKLGFFSPPNSKNRYLGIWYNHPSVIEVIWVANRNNPITDSSGILRLSDEGNLQLSNAKDQIFWSSNISNPTTHFSTEARLQNSGNFILQKNRTILWQSSQHPTDSFLPNTRLTIGQNSDLRHILQSWRSPSDPSRGRFSIGTYSSGIFQIIIWDDDRPHWRSGPWNGNIFIGTRYHNVGYGNIFINSGSFTQEDKGGITSLVFTGANESTLSHYSLSYEGIIAQKWWDDSNKKWGVTWKAPETVCDIYGTCGEFGSCNPQNSPICSCLKGFEPKNEKEWKRENWTSGCVRKKQLQCGVQGGGDGFLQLQKMKVPDHAEWTVGLSIDQCRSKCFNNCSCLAYAYDTGIACLTWSGSLVDIAVLSPGGADLYLRLPQSELGNSKTKLKVEIAVSVILGTTASALAAILWCLWKCGARPKSRSPPDRYTRSQLSPGNKVENKKAQPDPHVFRDKTQVISEDLQLLTFEKLSEATDNFHESNMLGRGGFGQVYKGKMEDGQEIAVKRLSRASGQGIEEFMNEVEVISKLQHRNLVKLLGCSAQGEEKMLIYEYMPNKSLDAFLFDSVKRELLDWEKRFIIIQGICRGLVYLHRDSRLRIIHRDLKASNILLDEDLNPKISDFGMARIFGGNQDQANTQRVVGTYGYMSPEYAMEGQFSEKSDVFSFGVLLLEIVSGKKNSSFWCQEESLSLLGYAWKMWNEDNIVSLIDPLISGLQFQGEIVRCIHVGLLCAQEYAKDRPSISTVMSMLVSEIVDLPNPKQPGFIQRQIYSTDDMGSFSISEENVSTNNVTITSLTAR